MLEGQWAGRRLLVVAPHPDDDVLGCGGTIALAAANGASVAVLYATDGAASHAGSAAYPPARLALVREAEALLALAELGLSSDAAEFVREPDSALAESPDSAARFETAIRAAFARSRPTHVFSPWIRDVHRDHVATARAVRAVVATLASAPQLYEYCVWSAAEDAGAYAPGAGECAIERVDISGVLARKTAALRAHRSQLGELIDDAASAFALPDWLLARAREPYETFRAIALSVRA